MRRSAGVTVIAILSLLGSLFALLMGVFVAALPLRSPDFGSGSPLFSPESFKVMMLLAAVIYVVPAVWGIATSIGLFRLKEWARISIIAFSILLILGCGSSTLILLLVPIQPPQSNATDPAVMSAVRIFMSAFAGGIAGIGIWWLAFFTRPKVRQQFAPVQALAIDATPASPNLLDSSSAYVPAVPRRPLSLTIIGWLLLVGCVSYPYLLALRSPALFLTTILTGWPATLYYMAVVVLHLYVGIGLLRLKPMARKVGVAYYGFFFLNMAIFYLSPGAYARITDMREKSMVRWMRNQPWPHQNGPLFDTTRFTIVIAAFTMAMVLVPLYFLVTRRRAFENAAAAAQPRSAQKA
ncbi:MAG: hypothetical protein WBS24_06175 [Terriglobales bacterium]